MKLYFAATDSNFTNKVGQFVSSSIEVAAGYINNSNGYKLFEGEINTTIDISIDMNGGTWKDFVEVKECTYFDHIEMKEKSYQRKSLVTTEEKRIEWSNLNLNVVEMKNIQDCGINGLKDKGVTTNYWLSSPCFLSNVKSL